MAEPTEEDVNHVLAKLDRALAHGDVMHLTRTQVRVLGAFVFNGLHVQANVESAVARAKAELDAPYEAGEERSPDPHVWLDRVLELLK